MPRRMLGLRLLCVLLAVACKKKEEPTPEPPPLYDARQRIEPETGVAWIQDDYPGAIARAKEAGKPVVIDMWAAWCHTCISMQEYVLAGPALEDVKERFVWLALDTEKEKNAPVLERFPISFWPTFFVVDPNDETVQARLVGAASLERFREFLEDGERAFLDARARGGALTEKDPLYWVRKGDQAAVAGSFAEASDAYSRALTLAPPGWKRRGDVLVSLATALDHAERWGECVDVGVQWLPGAGPSSATADLAAQAAACAEHLPERDPRRRKLLETSIARLEKLVANTGAPLSVDDRGDAMRILRELYDARGDHDKARATAEQQRALLDRAAKEAPSAWAASTFNWPRAEVYVYLGRGAELLPDLEASEKALPNEYDPPYRLAWVHFKLGNLDQAQAAAERALSRVYGPRKARIEDLLAQIRAARQQDSTP